MSYEIELLSRLAQRLLLQEKGPAWVREITAQALLVSQNYRALVDAQSHAEGREASADLTKSVGELSRLCLGHADMLLRFDDLMKTPPGNPAPTVQ